MCLPSPHSFSSFSASTSFSLPPPLPSSSSFSDLVSADNNGIDNNINDNNINVNNNIVNVNVFSIGSDSNINIQPNSLSADLCGEEKRNPPSTASASFSTAAVLKTNNDGIVKEEVKEEEEEEEEFGSERSSDYLRDSFNSNGNNMSFLSDLVTPLSTPLSTPLPAPRSLSLFTSLSTPIHHHHFSASNTNNIPTTTTTITTKEISTPQSSSLYFPTSLATSVPVFSTSSSSSLVSVPTLTHSHDEVERELEQRGSERGSDRGSVLFETPTGLSGKVSVSILTFKPICLPIHFTVRIIYIMMMLFLIFVVWFGCFFYAQRYIHPWKNQPHLQPHK